MNRWSGDTTKASRLAKLSRYTGRNTSSTLNVCSVRRPMEPPSMWASTLARYEKCVAKGVPFVVVCIVFIHRNAFRVHFKAQTRSSIVIQCVNTSFSLSLV